MRHLPLAVLVLALMLGILGAVCADPAKEDPKKLLDDAIKGTLGTSGYHFHLVVNNSAMKGEGNLDSTGAYKKPDLIQMTDSKLGDVVLKGKKGAIKQAGKNEWQDPGKALGPMGAMVFQVMPTPNDILGDLRGFAASAKLGTEEGDCKVVEMEGTPDQIREYIKKQLAKLGPMGGMIKPDLFDLKASKLTYKVLIGKEDKRVHKVENNATIPPGKPKEPRSPMPPVSLDANTSVEYTDYEKDLDLKFDDAVKQMLGIK